MRTLTFSHILNERVTGHSAYLSVAVVIFSVLVTVGFWITLPEQYSVDSGSDYKAFYKPVAQNMMNGNGPVLNGELATKFPPGYPLVLAGIFKISKWVGAGEDTGAAAINILGMAAASVLVFLLGQLMFGRLAGLVGAALWTTYPFVLWLTKQPNSEIPFMVCLYGAFFLFARLVVRETHGWSGYFLCGLILGFAMLIRPIAIGIGPVLAIVLWCALRRLRPRVRALAVSLFLLGNLIAVFPWETWVYSRTGVVIPLSTTGPKNMRDGLTFAVNVPPHRAVGGVPQDVEALMHDIWQHQEEMLSLRGIVGVVWLEIKTHPMALTKLYLLKAARSWYGTDTREHEQKILIIQLFYLSAICWAAITLWIRSRIHRKFVGVIMVVVVYFWGMNLLVNSTIRYMLPISALILLLPAAAVSLKARSETMNSRADESARANSSPNGQ